MKNFEVYLSEDRETVVLLFSDHEEQLTVPEFVEMYGEDLLPDAPADFSEEEEKLLEEEAEKELKARKESLLLERYYMSLLDFLESVGSFVHLYKMRENLADGVYPVQVVAYDYGHAGVIDQQIADRDAIRWRKLRVFNALSQSAGFLPIRKSDYLRIMSFFEDLDRRRYVRERVRRAMKKEERLSIADLMTLRYKVESKKK